MDAQREARASYIASQKHEGWVLSPELYDDGGFSGGNMNRPGLTALTAEVNAGRIEVIVVYKVDRLTRALSDFAKIVEVLDAQGASFVSVTQSFNTTTSMGRLTLNVLLSFAQFEREVTGERIRDKIAASKKKGMWMGRPVPLGYDVRDRKLVINDAEAETVRAIYLRDDRVAISVGLDALLPAAGGTSTTREVELIVPVSRLRSIRDTRNVITDHSIDTPADPALLKLLASAHAADQAMRETSASPLAEVAASHGYTPAYFTTLLRLATLAPDIIAAIVAGRQPPSLTRQRLANVTSLPLHWPGQRAAFGFSTAG